MAAKFFALFPTSIGTCAIAWREEGRGLAGVYLPEESSQATLARMKSRFSLAIEMAPPASVETAIFRITALLEGRHDDLVDVALDMEGVPPFHQRVYEIARAIPPGRTLTYGDIARKLGDVGASRAVGQALGHNPFAPVVPCHRILGADNRSGGFSGGNGVPLKLKMLEIERARFGPDAGLFD